MQVEGRKQVVFAFVPFEEILVIGLIKQRSDSLTNIAYILAFIVDNHVVQTVKTENYLRANRNTETT